MSVDKKMIESLRRDYGFVVSTEEDPDLLQYLINCYLNDQQPAVGEPDDHAEALRTKMAVLKEFVEHARKTLRANPPISMTYLYHGLGIQLSNQQFLPFVAPEDGKKEPSRNDTRAKGVVEVTTASQRGGGMRGMMQVPTDVPVTGVDKK
jgi:hypothetical protein